MIREKKHGKSGRTPLFLRKKQKQVLRFLFLIVFVLSAAGLTVYGIGCLSQNIGAWRTKEELQSMRKEAQNGGKCNKAQFYTGRIAAAVFADICGEMPPEEEDGKAPEILEQYKDLYQINPDLTGWLTIDGTVIDYPVMQTMEDESYYLSYDFYGKQNKNGCLILDTDSAAGTGTKEHDYADGTAPTTNLIVHGHNMKSGEMFGSLKSYADAAYGMEHKIIRFDSLYEEREYELIAVFYSQVYYESDNVFKYYKFFQADTQEEFDDWYENIRELSLYDTGVTAQFGDEFITLSTCSYHVEDGRFVVVGKRIK